jgi:hypothetical protein
MSEAMDGSANGPTNGPANETWSGSRQIPTTVINQYLAELDRLKDEAGFLAESKVELDRKVKANTDRQAVIKKAVDGILYGRDGRDKR